MGAPSEERCRRRIGRQMDQAALTYGDSWMQSTGTVRCALAGGMERSRCSIELKNDDLCTVFQGWHVT